MIERLDVGADDVLAYRLSGRLRADDIEEMVGALDEILERHDRVRAYAEAFELSFTVRALLTDLALGVKRLGALSRIDRAAVVTDVDWVRRVGALEDALFRRIEIETFAPEERERARAWLLERDGPGSEAR